MSKLTVDVVSADGKKTGKADLPSAIFDVQTNIPLIHQVVVAQLAAARQGTHSTKGRGEVRGGGAKPWRQKGTGRARHGSRRSPIWTGGGIVHGPKPRKYDQRTPKKMVAAALRGALSDRVRDEALFVLSSIVEGEKPSTKAALAAIASVTDSNKVLVVLDRSEDVAWLSLRNAVNVHALAVDQLNAYDVVVNDVVIFTSAALETFSAGPAASYTAVAHEDEVPADILKAAAAAAPKAVAEEPAKAKKAKKAKKDEEPKAKKSKKTDEEPKAKKAKKSEEPKAKKAKPAAEEAPYGDGSYKGDEPPAGYDIKGNEDSMKYHTTESPWYGRTIAEVWFNSEAAAEAAGFVNVSAKADAKEESDK